MLAAQTVPFFYSRRMAGPEPWTVMEYLPVIGASLPLIVRRRYPLAVLISIILASNAYSLHDPDIPPQPLWYGELVATYTVAQLSPRWQRLGIILIMVPGTILFGGNSVPTLVRGHLTWAAAYALGRAAAVYQAYAKVLEERAAQLERERELEAERAAERERARIARDMHDILAHAVSIMVVQAEAGPLAVRTNPDRAEAAFDAIGAAGREAMAQLRRMLGLLKETEGPRDPQPTIDRIPELLGRVGETGPRVSLTTTGQPLVLSSDVEIAAYRIVQESLTNMVKHAAATEAEVRLDWADDALLITVTDDGRGPAPSVRRGSEASRGADTERDSGGRRGPDAREPDVRRGVDPCGPGFSGGNGLIGIRERAAACGGSATFGVPPGRTHGFQVSVRLPLADAETEGKQRGERRDSSHIAGPVRVSGKVTT
ncbi:two-component sensor histidine kinase [Microtetraspora sp. NBRC 16547]|nr:two-component sensor histidine kinase [Microtetraspora sp. NBRC 16547]